MEQDIPDDLGHVLPVNIALQTQPGPMSARQIIRALLGRGLAGGAYHAEIRHRGTQKHHVGTGFQLLGDLVGVEGNDMLKLTQFSVDLLHIRIIADVDEGIIVGDNPAFLTQPRQITKGFHRFGREDDVGLTLWDDVGKDFIVGDSRFKYIYEENRCVAAARNNAINASNGKYILPLDPDDIIDKEYMEKAVSFLDSHCDYSIYYGACLRFGEGIRPYNWGILYSGYKELLKVNSIYNAAVFRRADFDKSGGYNESIPSHEDWEFYVRLLYHNDKVYQTDDVVFYYRQVQASRNSHTSRKYRKAFPLIISLNKQIYAEYGVSNKWYKRLYYKLRDKNK